MNISILSPSEFEHRLSKLGLFFKSGPFTIRLQSNLPALPSWMHQLYADYPVVNTPVFADFHVRLVRRRCLRNRFKADACFLFDESKPLGVFPESIAPPFFEWGLNWCVATRTHQYLILHSGVLEKSGRAMILAAWPGAGKSTLSAALSHRGWRLLSDEFGLVRPTDLALTPLPRPVALKNESIATIRTFVPEAVMGPEYAKTHKGTVSHLKPLTESVERSNETAQANWIVFPQYRAGATLRLEPMAKARAFLKLAGNSFNYELIGLRGFETVSGLLDACDCYTFEYGGDLEQAVAQLNALADGLI